MEFMFSLDSKEEFCIPIEKLVEKGIDTRLDSAKRRIKSEQYTEGEDYSLIIEKSNGGRPSTKIMLSVDCFKDACMQSQNEFGKKTRTYYLKLEELYKNYLKISFETSQEIILQQEEKLRLLQTQEKENLQKINLLQKLKTKEKEPRRNFATGYFIYIVVDTHFRIDHQLKIGITTDLKDRLSTYETSKRSCYVYYRDCEDKENMKDVEKHIKKRNVQLIKCKIIVNIISCQKA